MPVESFTKEHAAAMELAILRELGPQYLEMRKLTRTRRYFVPGGHCDPSRLALNIECLMFNCLVLYDGDIRALEVVDRYAFFVAARLMEKKMPVYFVDQGILDAVLNTEPPENMLFEDLHWPMSVCGFIPPENGIKSPNGGYLLNLSYSFTESKVPVKVPGIPELDVSAAAEGMSHCIGIFATTSRGETYAQYIPLNLTMDVGGFMAFANTAKFHYTDTVADSNKLGDEDVNYNRFLLSLVLRLVMVMAARPNLVTSGERKTPAKSVKGEMPKPECWTPNWIGYKYQATHHRGTGMGGHKAIHWRVGHWRNQAHGPRHSLRRLLWIEPVLIGE